MHIACPHSCSYAAIRFYLPKFRLIKAGLSSSESMLLCDGPPGLTSLDWSRCIIGLYITMALGWIPWTLPGGRFGGSQPSFSRHGRRDGPGRSVNDGEEAAVLRANVRDPWNRTRAVLDTWMDSVAVVRDTPGRRKLSWAI